MNFQTHFKGIFEEKKTFEILIKSLKEYLKKMEKYFGELSKKLKKNFLGNNCRNVGKFKLHYMKQTRLSNNCFCIQ